MVSGTNCTGPDHAYLVAGDMSITITVTGSVSGSASSKGSIHVVKPGIPVGAVSIPDPSWVRNFTSAWADFVPSQLAETYTCTVDYGDGNGARPSTISGSTCVGPWATYNNAGSYTVTIAVTGSISGTGLSTTPVTVAIPPKMDAIHAPASTIAGSAISASADFTPPPAFNPTYTCLVDYGDGTGQQAGTVTGHTCQGPSHTYTAWGTYSISVVIIVWIRPDASISIAGSQTISVLC